MIKKTKKKGNKISTEDIIIDIFKIPFLDDFNKFTLFKKKYLRANYSRFDQRELTLKNGICILKITWISLFAKLNTREFLC